MDLEAVRNHCLSLPQTDETTPFGPELWVYKVVGKVFAILSPDDDPPRVNLKCDPDRALDLRDQYDAIVPGYHMNKKHWNTVLLDRRLPSALVRELIDHSFDLVVASLPVKKRVTRQNTRGYA